MFLAKSAYPITSHSYSYFQPIYSEKEHEHMDYRISQERGCQAHIMQSHVDGFELGITLFKTMRANRGRPTKRKQKDMPSLWIMYIASDRR